MRRLQVRGQAEIHLRPVHSVCDFRWTTNYDTGDSVDDGHVVLDGGHNDEHVEAYFIANVYNLRGESGRFQHVSRDDRHANCGETHGLTPKIPLPLTAEWWRKPVQTIRSLRRNHTTARCRNPNGSQRTQDWSWKLRNATHLSQHSSASRAFRFCIFPSRPPGGARAEDSYWAFLIPMSAAHSIKGERFLGE